MIMTDPMKAQKKKENRVVGKITGKRQSRALNARKCMGNKCCVWLMYDEIRQGAELNQGKSSNGAPKNGR